MNLFVILRRHWSDIRFPDIIEFGCFRGGTTIFLATILKELREDARLYALDTFSGLPQASAASDLHREGDFASCSLASVRKRCDELGLDNVTFLAGRIQDTYPRGLEGQRRFGLAHVDCDTYEAVKFACDAVWPDLGPGGYLVLDDADGSSCLGATEAMEQLVMDRRIHSEQAWPHFVFRKTDLRAICDQTELDKIIRTRRQTREFRTDPLPADLLDEVLSLMHSAPSVGNSKPWRLIRIESDDGHSALKACFDRADGVTRAQLPPEQLVKYDRLGLARFLDAPVQLAVFTDLKPSAGHGQGSTTLPEALEQSTIGAIHTLWLAAVARGMGFAWGSTFYADDMQNAFGQPNWKFTAHIALGWPARQMDRPRNETCGFQGNTPLQIYNR